MYQLCEINIILLFITYFKHPMHVYIFEMESSLIFENYSLYVSLFYYYYYGFCYCIGDEQFGDTCRMVKWTSSFWNE